MKMKDSTLVSMNILPLMVLICALVWLCTGSAQAQQASGPSELPRPADPHFTGLTKCAACHFDQYKDWQTSEHAKAFEILPAKYRDDAACLKCHTTGTPGDVSSYQYGVSCQACHGPGGEHANYALRFINEQITEEGLTTLRGKIQRLDLRQCVNCHISKAHQKHPPYEGQEELKRIRLSQSVSFFESIHSDPPDDTDNSRRLTSQPLDNRLQTNQDLGAGAVVGTALLPSGRLLRLDCLRPL